MRQTAENVSVYILVMAYFLYIQRNRNQTQVHTCSFLQEYFFEIVRCVFISVCQYKYPKTTSGNIKNQKSKIRREAPGTRREE